MKKTIIVLSVIIISFSMKMWADSYSLDSCRSLAVKHNKGLLIGKQKQIVAYNQRKEAQTNYFPKVSFQGGYVRTQKEISLLSDQQKSSLAGLGTNFSQAAQQIGQLYPDLLPLITSLSETVAPTLNGVGASIADGFRTDTRNTYVGVLTLTQPLFMGGKIRLYNEIARYAERIADEQYDTELQNVILSVDQAYWQVISLVNKKKLAESYLQLLNQLNSDITKMVEEGFATKADALTVLVKKNEAEMALTKVNNGLSLARMLLCQLCGMEITQHIQLADEFLDSIPVSTVSGKFDLEEVYASRPELKSLDLLTQIRKSNVRIAKAGYLPSIALVGNYFVSNPSLYNGFEKKFKGNWSIGIMANMPIWNWRETAYKIRQSKAEANIAQLELEDAREKIDLQVNQASFQVDEDMHKLAMAKNNMRRAEENLHYANVGFKEGVIPTSNLLEAQTAWLQAHSENLDAQIDVKMSELYLKKAMGKLLLNQY